MQLSLRAHLLAFFALAALAFIPNGAEAAQITVYMTGSSTFSPQNITINPGDTVTWINQSGTDHTVTADNGYFDSGTIQNGQQFSATFNAAGSYQYYCKFHGGIGSKGMSGSIVVANASIPNPSPAPSPSPAPTAVPQGTDAASLQARVAALIAQIQALQGQLGVGGTTTVTPTAGGNSSSCPQIGGTLKRGSSGDAVNRLQQFLANDPDVYPEAQVTGFYGALTEKAVQHWQTKYHVVSSGAPDTTGYGVVGPRTAAAIAILCSTGSYNGVAGPSGSTGPVGGYITVSPVSGQAPLQVNVVATVNTVKSCSAAIYTLDFGDGTQTQQIPVSAGVCAQGSQTIPHTYQYGGTYNITLSANGHQTSASVSVTGTAAPAKPVQTPGLPAESFVATPTTGGAPLAVTFSGTVNSNDAGFCATGCVDTLVYGDGTADTVQLPATVGGWLSYSLTHTYSQQGGFRATLYQGGAQQGGPTVGSVTIVVTQGTSGGGTTSTYQPPLLTGNVNNDPHQVQVQFDMDQNACGGNGTTLTWGDGSGTSSANSGIACSGTPTLNHTYGSTGSYTITLTRNTRTDTIGVTIQ